MLKILIDDELNAQFAKNGFAKFQLFDSEQIKELRKYYSENAFLQKKEGVSFNTTSNSGDIDLVKKVSGYLMTHYFLPGLKKHLCNYELTISNFLVKESGDNSAVRAHQDWLLVDESRFVSFNCWVCLEDADYRTGNMQFIPGSHLFQRCIRAAHTDRFFERNCKSVLDYMVDVPTKAGECVIFNHGVIHASRKNRSGHPRIAVVAGGYSGDAELLFYYKADRDQEYIEKYEITKDSLLKMRPNERPLNGKLIAEIPSDVNYITDEEFRELCSARVGHLYVIRNKILNSFIGKSN